MSLVLYLVGALAGLALMVGFSYRCWQRLTERERFLLGMKEASTPKKMLPDERSKLKLLRSPWWAFWRWLPDPSGTALLYFSSGGGSWAVVVLRGGGDNLAAPHFSFHEANLPFQRSLPLLPSFDVSFAAETCDLVLRCQTEITSQRVALSPYGCIGPKGKRKL
jgi:hypothetical protein